MPNETALNTTLNTSNLNTILHSTQLQQFNHQVESWILWHEKLKIHFIETSCEEENIKKATLLKLIGSEPYKLLHNICSPRVPASKTYEQLCQILEQHYTPPTIVFLERKKFYSAEKSETESVAAWFARVKELAINCKFGSHLDSNVLDKFIMGLPPHIFDRLCEENENLTTNDALSKALIVEIRQRDKNGLPSSSSFSSVNAISNKHNNNNNNSSGNNNNSRNKNNSRNNSNSRVNQPCTHCGWRNHTSQNCKFKNSRCNNCHKIGHISSICRNKSNNVSYINENNDYNESNDFSVYSISGYNTINDFKIEILVDGSKHAFCIDTGSPCSLVPRTFTKYFDKLKIMNCSVPYVTYNGDNINIIGEYKTCVSYNGITEPLNLIITNTTCPPLLGRDFLYKFGFKLKQVNNVSVLDHNMIIGNIKSNFKDIFEDGLGKFKSYKVKLVIDETAKPVFCKPRPIPLAWKSQVEKEIQDLIKNDVLEFIEHSDWGTPLVPILKPNGNLRICGDYKTTINKFLSDYNYPLPRIDEIFASLGGNTIFSKLDLSNAYNQLELDEESQKVCTWSTHLGTFKMKRMPFGIKPAASIFQKVIEGLFRGMPGVVVYQDDITVAGRDLNNHLDVLTKVLTKLRESGLRLNASKCEFLKKEISYLGFNISKEGLQKNDDRTVNIMKAPSPTNVTELRAFIGIANYYSKFIANFSNKMYPLYKLLKKDSKFLWDEKCEMSYKLIKEEITSDRVLTHFNPKLPIIITTDASNNAVAAVLSHEYPDKTQKPVAFVSRSLNKSEMNYSTLEKEALAIIFAVTKLKQYLLGYHFILKTDHKPLLTILGENKGLPLMAAARIQRWAFILSGFNYSIQYVKGNVNEADNLSRMPQCVTQKNIEESSYINLINKEYPLDLSYKDIQRETRNDVVLSKLHFAILNAKQAELNSEDLNPFKHKIHQLTVEKGCILWGHRVVIPTKLKNIVLESLHRSHMGMVKTKGLARSYVWWPKIDHDIETMIKNCHSCQETQPSPQKSKLIPWQQADTVWSRIHIDYAGPVDNYYLLVIIDSYSKWVEVFKTHNITTSFTLTKLRETFWRYGLVDTIVTDNGRQFVSHEFETFLKNNNIRHVLTAPGHPATNGQAENFIKTLKKSLYASSKNFQNQNLDNIMNQFLFDYRNTVHCATNETPSKLFLGRILKSRFSHLKPPSYKHNCELVQDNYIQNYAGKRNASYAAGDKVFIRDYTNPNKEKWSEAVVKSQIGPRCYQCVFTQSNREIKRHLDQIRGVHNNEIPDEGITQNAALIPEQVDNSANQPNDCVISETSDINDACESLNNFDTYQSNNKNRDVINDTQCRKKNESDVDSRKLRPRKDGKVIKDQSHSIN